MTSYACHNTTCPRRAPVTADTPPTCYTCGVAMTMIEVDPHGPIAAINPADATCSFGGIAIVGVPAGVDTFTAWPDLAFGTSDLCGDGLPPISESAIARAQRTATCDVARGIHVLGQDAATATACQCGSNPAHVTDGCRALVAPIGVPPPAAAHSSCPHTECSCDCTTCEAAHATTRSPCLCRSCATLRVRAEADRADRRALNAGWKPGSAYTPGQCVTVDSALRDCADAMSAVLPPPDIRVDIPEPTPDQISSREIGPLSISVSPAAIDVDRLERHLQEVIMRALTSADPTRPAPYAVGDEVEWRKGPCDLEWHAGRVTSVVDGRPNDGINKPFWVVRVDTAGERRFASSAVIQMCLRRCYPDSVEAKSR